MGRWWGIDPIRRMRPPSVVFDHLSSLIYRASAQIAILPDEAAGPGQVSLRWLETFVERERFAGTCYRAANWQCWRRSAMELKTIANPQMRPLTPNTRRPAALEPEAGCGTSEQPYGGQNEISSRLLPSSLRRCSREATCVGAPMYRRPTVPTAQARGRAGTCHRTARFGHADKAPLRRGIAC